jgi:hypothetical protein
MPPISTVMMLDHHDDRHDHEADGDEADGGDLMVAI